jgi:glycosyltransferase involved in cell wall biosynthesis
MPELNTGGAEQVITLIINSIERELFDIRVILFNSRGDLVNRVSSDIEVYNLNVSSVTYGVVPLLRKIYQIKPDILFSGIGHLNISIAPFIPIFRYISPKTYWVARQTSILSLNNQKEKSPKLYEWLYKRVYKNYNKVISQSNYMQRDLIDNYSFPIEKSIVINNPVDIDRIEQLSLKEPEYSFDTTKFNLLSVGQLRSEKRQEHMLKALAKLNSDYFLTLIGDGERRASLEQMAYSLGITKSIRFIGYQTNPYSYMREADILLLSSEYEGFPNVVLEANVCGLGVVSYRCAGGVIEIIEDGVNGFLAIDDNIDSLVDSIKRAREYQFDSNSIKNRIIERYNKSLIIDKYQKILKERISYE